MYFCFHAWMTTRVSLTLRNHSWFKHERLPRNRSIVATDRWWRSMPLDHFLHDTANGFRVDMAIDIDHRTLAGLLVEDGQHFETPTADRFIVDKIPAPNMAGMFGFCLQAGGDTPASASWLALGDPPSPVHVADAARIEHWPQATSLSATCRLCPGLTVFLRGSPAQSLSPASCPPASVLTAHSPSQAPSSAWPD